MIYLKRILWIVPIIIGICFAFIGALLVVPALYVMFGMDEVPDEIFDYKHLINGGVR